MTRLLFAAPEFYRANPKKIRAVDDPNIGVTHFLLNGKVVAVGELPQ